MKLSSLWLLQHREKTAACCPFRVTEEETQKVTASLAAANEISVHAALLPQLSSAGIFPFVEEQRMPL